MKIKAIVGAFLFILFSAPVLANTSKSDGFGVALVPGLQAKDIVALIAPGRSVALATLVGAKAWPHRPNSFVAIACFAASKKEYEDDLRSSKEPSCTKYYDPSEGDGRDYIDKAVYLGLLEYQAGKPAKLIASYSKPLDVKTSWKWTQQPGPSGKFSAPSSDESDLMPEEYMRFDFAPFKISDTDTAFGLRLGWRDIYAGGGAYFEALALFKVDGDKLRNVLAQPLRFEQDTAGKWNEDGTRDRKSLDGNNVLSMLSSKTEGYYDLQISGGKRKWKRVFIWDGKSKSYRPALATPEKK